MGRDSLMALATVLVVVAACAAQPTTITDGWPTLTIDVSWSSAPMRPEPAVDLSQRRTAPPGSCAGRVQAAPCAEGDRG